MIESSAGTRPIQSGGWDATEVSVARFSITVVEGPDKGHSVSLTSTALHIGTESTNDLVLEDPTVSKRHAMVTLTARGVLVEDLDSLNGTYVDGTRVQGAYVREASTMQVGATILKISQAPVRFVVIPEDETSFQGIVAQSRAMREVFALVRQLARTDLPVTITGETGTGKELIARALHQAGPRSDKKFLVLDCGAILPELLRSELFGHERGAFTGADKMTRGILEEAAGGTVFLDEVGEIDLSVQPNLLRALETKEVCRLGSRTSIPVDFRVVSATNRDLRKRAGEGIFREDLYFRLSCVTIRLPALRERKEDIPLVARHFLQQCAARHDAPAPSLSPGALALLVDYRWPGNLRELRNIMEAVWVMADRKPVLESHVLAALPPAEEPAAGSTAAPPTRPGTGTLEVTEMQAIEQALQSTNWNRKEAAKRLGIARSTIFEKIRLYGLKPPSKMP